MNKTHRVRVDQLPDIARLCLRQAHGGKLPRKRGTFQGPEGHGEKIWVFAHRRSDQVIYSFDSKLDGFHDMKQLPYNGKKTKPAKLRKDYWSPMAKIEFPTGAGEVGRTVFQKLRELKRLHEVAWDDSLLYKDPLQYTEVEKKVVAKAVAAKEPVPRFMRSKADRGQALNAQKANSIADIAAVLGGAGPGNKMKFVNKHGFNERVKVTVNWSDVMDAGYATAWSGNVKHSELTEPVEPVEIVEELELPAEAKAAA